VARRKLTQTEAQDWAAYAGLVKPLPGRPLPSLGADPLPRPSAAPAAPPAPVPTRPVPQRWGPLAIGDQPPGVDNATWRRLRSGKLGIARSLDLHGHTAQRAYHALESFLRTAQAERIRCVEVITGRGAGEAGGVLRRELPLWLNLPHIRPMVLAAVHPHAANVGATRLLLRRGS